MFHVFTGRLLQEQGAQYLVNDIMGIETHYQGKQQEGTFFLAHYIDDNKKQVVYYAFDSISQKQAYDAAHKISGVGPKTAYHISQIPQDELAQAVEELDFKVVQAIPGVGPKTAKRILLDMKDSFKKSDVVAMDQHQSIIKNVSASLKSLGYDTARVKDLLAKYPGNLGTDELGIVVKWLLEQLSS